MADTAISSFAYHAQTQTGSPIAGTIDTAGVEQATAALRSLQLRIIDIQAAPAPPRPRALRGDDFVAFNQQLAHLTAAGLPMEHGLRLIAEDMRSGRLAQTVRQIADELEKGKSLADVFQSQRGRFPSMYGRLLEAGVRSNNLSGMLFNLAKHLELIQRLRAILWRSAAYPLMVCLALVLVVGFLGVFVLPKFEKIFMDFHVALPQITLLVLSVSRALPAILIVVLAVVFLAPLIAWALRLAGLDGQARDLFVRPMPLIGPVYRRSLIAGWCDTLRMGVEAGLDLPAAIELAGDASGSPLARQESRELIEQLNRGGDLKSVRRGRILPATVLAAISLGVEQHDLPRTLQSVGEMYQQQAEMRLTALPAVLSPVLIMTTAVMIAFVVLSMVMPLVALIGAVSGGGKR